MKTIALALASLSSAASAAPFGWVGSIGFRGAHSEASSVEGGLKTDVGVRLYNLDVAYGAGQLLERGRTVGLSHSVARLYLGAGYLAYSTTFTGQYHDVFSLGIGASPNECINRGSLYGELGYRRSSVRPAAAIVGFGVRLSNVECVTAVPLDSAPFIPVILKVPMMK